MTHSVFIALLPEWVLLAGALALFVVSLGDHLTRRARIVALVTALAAVLASAGCLGERGTFFSGAYQVDGFSQLLKLVVALGFLLVLLLNGELPDIRGDAKPEYYLLLNLGVCGLVVLLSAVDAITLVVALELSSFPLYYLVSMRREREGQRMQMESAIKYIMFGVAANGIMLFGLSYLFGLTGTTSLPQMLPKLQAVAHSPLAIVGLAMTFCGFFYKLAVFPFQFWTPDVYEGAANETAGIVASLPKVVAVAVLVRFVSLAPPEHQTIAMLLTVLAVASMLYGNLIALWQKDLKRLLGFSGIAHAGYAMLGFVTLAPEGYAAAIYYMVGYLFMVLACFVVICRVSRDGRNVPLEDLAGLHRRSPLLAVTLVVGVFALAGIPPFVGFMGKLALLKAALTKGYLALVVIAVVNTAIAIYYYLGIVREAFFRDAAESAPLVIGWPTKALCLALIAGILVLGIAPQRFLQSLSSSLQALNSTPPPAATALVVNRGLPAVATAQPSP